MAKGEYAVVGGTTRKIKREYAVIGNKTRKIKRKYAVVDGKTRLIWSGSSPMFVQVTRNTSVYPYGGVIRYSENGQSWTSLDMQLGNSSDNYLYYNTVVFGNGVYVASFYGGYLAYSTDGTSWTKVTTLQSNSQTTYMTTRVFFCNGEFIAFIFQETPYVNVYYYVYTSTDGKNWTYVNSFVSLGDSGGLNRYISSLVYGKIPDISDKVYIALIDNYLYYSSDLATWTKFMENVYAIHMKPNYDYPFFIKKESSYFYYYYYRTGYFNWSYNDFSDSSGYDYKASVYNENDKTIYFYAGNGGYLWKWDLTDKADDNYYYTTKENWIPSDSMPINVVIGNGLFVGYTTSNMLYSTDGQTWTVSTSATSDKDNTQICFGK